MCRNIYFINESPISDSKVTSKLFTCFTKNIVDNFRISQLCYSFVTPFYFWSYVCCLTENTKINAQNFFYFNENKSVSLMQSSNIPFRSVKPTELLKASVIDKTGQFFFCWIMTRLCSYGEQRLSNQVDLNLSKCLDLILAERKKRLSKNFQTLVLIAFCNRNVSESWKPKKEHHDRFFLLEKFLDVHFPKADQSDRLKMSVGKFSNQRLGEFDWSREKERVKRDQDSDFWKHNFWLFIIKTALISWKILFPIANSFKRVAKEVNWSKWLMWRREFRRRM